MTFQNPNTVEGFLIDSVHSISTSSGYKKYVEDLHLQGNESLLDFGCGGAWMSRYFVEVLKNGHLICLDTSPYWLTKARKRLKKYNNVEFLLGDIHQHDIRDSSLDVVSIHFVLHDINKADRQPIIDCLASKLKTRGRLFIREPTKEKHGMQPEEVDDVMEAAGLKKILAKKMKKLFMPPMYFAVFSREK